MPRRLLACAALAACATNAHAQKLRSQLGGLLTFGDWGVPLRVGTLAPGAQAVVPSDAFATVAANAALGGFLTDWMTASAASAPLAASGGGRTFRFVGGVPVPDRPAPGPIFGERATTLGRGGLLAGVNYTGVRYTRVRGIPLDALRITLTQGGAAGADAIDLRAALGYDLAITALFATVGVLDRVDVGVVVPVVQARLTGESTARVIPRAGGAPTTVLGGSAAAPVLATQQNVGGRAGGLGDVALRAKVNLVDRPSGGLGVLGDVRLPTGDADDLLGSGALSARVLAVYSGRFGAVTPHANVGYLYFADRGINDAVLATLGVDADMAPWATVSLSLLGQFHPGASAYRLPSTAPGAARAANIPTLRDDALSTSIGVKLGRGGTRATANVLAPATRGGPRPDLAYTFGLERAF